MSRLLLLFAALLSCWSVPASAERPKIGLVLAGGGARGAAHIGVIQELERQRIPIDYIAGTSMGAIIGGLYASGLNAQELEQAYSSIDWEGIFADTPDRRHLAQRRKIDEAVFLVDKEIGIKDGQVRLPAGILKGQKLYLKLKDLTLPVSEVEDFDQLSIPFRAIATDITTGQTVELDSGDLATAIRASMSVPGLFPPVLVNDQLLVDGGVSDNLPIQTVRDMGADIVVAVDISSPLLERDQLESALSIVVQLTGILTQRNVQAQLKTLGSEDILIKPKLGDYSSANFVDALSLLQPGVAATQDQEDNLSRLALNDEAYGEHLASRDRTKREAPVVAFVRVENNTRLDDEVLLERLEIEVGQPLNLPQLDERIGDIYGFDIFESVRYRLETEGEETGVVVEVREKPWGPDYLQLGLGLSSSGEDSSFNLSIGHIRTPINRYNGEWRSVFSIGNDLGLFTQLYQPLGLGSRNFFQGELFFTDEQFNTVSDGVILAENQVRRLGFNLGLGRELGTWGRIRFGVTRFVGDTETVVGQPMVSESLDGGEFFARFSIDTLDDINFPKNGLFGFTGVRLSRDELGADEDFDQFEFDLAAARTFGSHTIHLTGELFTTFAGEAPIQNNFRLGGLFNLPGFSRNELSDQNQLLLQAGYMRPFRVFPSWESYAGFTVELGNVFPDKDDISTSDSILAGSVWMGAETLLGPAYLGYGFAEEGRDSIHFLLGRQFQ